MKQGIYEVVAGVFTRDLVAMYQELLDTGEIANQPDTTVQTAVWLLEKGYIELR